MSQGHNVDKEAMKRIGSSLLVFLAAIFPMIILVPIIMFQHMTGPLRTALILAPMFIVLIWGVFALHKATDEAIDD